MIKQTTTKQNKNSQKKIKNDIKIKKRLNNKKYNL